LERFSLPPDSSAEALLQVHELTVRFPSGDGREIPAVEGVSFEIAAGEVVGLLGESGCGKTSTALSLLRLLPPAGRIVGGSIRFRGIELLSLEERQLEKIRGNQVSVIFQEPSLALNPVMRVGEQISEVLRAHRPGDRRRYREEARAMLYQVRLADADRIYDAYPHQLSGGQRQRVVIAQALVCQPALVIADEPTAALDTTVQAEILALLGELKRQLKIAFLLISHNPAVLATLADRLLVMYAGRIVEAGGLRDVFRQPLHPYTAALLMASPLAEGGPVPAASRRLPSIPGAPPDLAHLPPCCPFASRCPEKMNACTMREPMEVKPEDRRSVRCFKYGG
jgi:oligopeptide/dipeptide ABC transporter ATP-binding protein